MSNNLDFIQQYVTELREEFKSFMRDYHNDAVKIWTELAKIDERMKTMKEDQKKQAQWHGLVGGMVPVLITLGLAILLWYFTGVTNTPPTVEKKPSKPPITGSP